MFCSKCSIELPEVARFCPKCGQALITSNGVEDAHDGNVINEEYKFVRNRNEILRGVPWAVDTTLVNLKQNSMEIKMQRRILSFFNQTKIDITVNIKDVHSIIVKKKLLMSRIIGVLIIIALVIVFGTERPLRALLSLVYAAYLFSGRYCYKMYIYTKSDNLIIPPIPYEARGENGFDAMVKRIRNINKDVVAKVHS